MLVAALAGVARLDEIAALANAGTLAAFIAVAVCLLVLRKRDPARKRVFRTPLAWVVGPIAILGCLYLFWSLPQTHAALVPGLERHRRGRPIWPTVAAPACWRADRRHESGEP